MTTFFTLSPQTTGFLPVVSPLLPASHVREMSARVSRSRLISGGAVISHRGFSHGDRSMTLETELSPADRARLESMLAAETAWTLGLPDGMYQCAISQINGERPVRISVLIAQKYPLWSGSAVDSPPTSGTVYTWAVSASGDDGYWAPAGSSFVDFTATDNYIAVGTNHLVEKFNAFYRFVGVAIPNGATIFSARLKMVADYSIGDAADMAWRFSAVYADNAAAPTSQAEANGLTLTTANAMQTNVEVWSQGNEYYSPDFGGAIQEVVTRPGWSSGNAIVVAVENEVTAASTERDAVSYDAAPANAAVLEVEVG